MLEIAKSLGPVVGNLVSVLVSRGVDITSIYSSEVELNRLLHSSRFRQVRIYTQDPHSPRSCDPEDPTRTDGVEYFGWSQPIPARSTSHKTSGCRESLETSASPCRIALNNKYRFFQSCALRGPIGELRLCLFEG